MSFFILPGKKKVTLELFVSFAIVFTSTLHSIYFYQIKLAPFPIISFALLVLSQKTIGKDILYWIIGIYFVFFINSFFGFIYSGSSYYFNSLLGIIIGPMYFIFFISKYKSNLFYLEKAVYLSLLTHIVFFYVQFLSFHFLGLQINYLEAITGEQSRIEGVGVLTNLIRSSGLCNEPASYSLFVNMLTFYLITIQRKLNLIVLLALLSCLLSFSASGIVFVVLNIIYFLLFVIKGYTKVFYYFVVILLFVLAFGYFYFDLIKLFFESRFVLSDEDASLNVRFNDGFNYFFSQNIFKQLTGLGIGNYPDENTSTVASGYMAIFVHLGYFFTAIFLLINLCLLKVLKYRWILALIFFLFLSSSMTFLNIHYWMFFAIGALVSQYDKNTPLRRY